MDYRADDPDGKLLDTGIRKLLIFGGWDEEMEAADPVKANIKYLQKVLNTLADPEHRIDHKYGI